MSYSVSAVGKPAAVIAKLAKDLSMSKCPEPEESIKGKVMEAIETALSAFPEGTAVQVDVSGSQHSGFPDGKSLNSLTLTIKPLYGFVE